MAWMADENFVKVLKSATNSCQPPPLGSLTGLASARCNLSSIRMQPQAVNDKVLQGRGRKSVHAYEPSALGMRQLAAQGVEES